MASTYIEELLESLKGLYSSGELSDLIVECAGEKHHVHKAVVLPRAPGLQVAPGLHNGESGARNCINLSEDDPQAVKLMLHYLYHLDYPHVPTDGRDSLGIDASSEVAAKNINLANGVYQVEEGIPPYQATSTRTLNGNSGPEAPKNVGDPSGGVKLSTSTIPEYSIEKEAFITSPSSHTTSAGVNGGSPKDALADDPDANLSNKARKKKKKLRSLTGLVEPAAQATNGALSASVEDDSVTSPKTLEPMVLANGASASKTNGSRHDGHHPIPDTAAAPEVPPPSTATSSACEPSSGANKSLFPNLTIHARLYALATKYSILGLRSLSSAKFRAELDYHWASADFLLATREAYTSTPREDRALRDAVLDAIKVHQDVLLARGEVREVIRGLELSFDLLMVLHGGGGGGGSGGGGAGLMNGHGLMNGAGSVSSQTSSVVNGSVGNGGGSFIAGQAMYGRGLSSGVPVYV